MTFDELVAVVQQQIERKLQRGDLPMREIKQEIIGAGDIDPNELLLPGMIGWTLLEKAIKTIIDNLIAEDASLDTRITLLDGRVVVLEAESPVQNARLNALESRPAIELPSAGLTVGTTAADIPGLSYTIPVGQGGNYEVTVSLDLTATVAAGLFFGALSVNGTPKSAQIIVNEPTNASRGAFSKTWLANGVAAGQIIKATAFRVGGGFSIGANHSTMVVRRIA